MADNVTRAEVPLEGGLGVVFLDWIWTKLLSLSALPNLLSSLCAPCFSSPRCVSIIWVLLGPISTFSSAHSAYVSQPAVRPHSCHHIWSSAPLWFHPVSSEATVLWCGDNPGPWLVSFPLLSLYIFPFLSHLPFLQFCIFVSLSSASILSPLLFFPSTRPWSLSRNWAWPNSPLLRLMGLASIKPGLMAGCR